MDNVIYTGIFIDHRLLLDELYAHNPSIARLGRLEKVLSSNYISVAFRPEEGDAESHKKFFGKRIILKLVGYGRDDSNEGLKAEIHPTGDEELDYILRAVADPVIPISTSAKGLAKNTKTLKFWSLFNPIMIEGVYAGVDSKGKMIGVDDGKVPDTHESK